MNAFCKYLGVAALLSSALAPSQAQDQGSAFGSTENTGAALIGIFYDLKQDQKGQALSDQYMTALGEFLKSGWDENVLSRFYRVTRPIYATQVFIPNMGAGGAPKAFNVEKIVRPQQWFVIYKGQVSPPEDGTYRFVGIADDVLAVAVNGKTSLVSHFGNWPDHSNWVEPEPNSPNVKVESGKLRHGEWFEARKGEPIDIDILIGEYPGTAFGAWVLIEKKGAQYKWIDHPKFGRQPVLPVFQVMAQGVPAGDHGVPYTTDSPPWICHQ